MDNMLLVALAVVAGTFVFLFSGQLIGAALATVGVLILIYASGGTGQLAMLGRIEYNAADSFTWAAVPLFIFMANVLVYVGLSDLIYIGASPLVSYIPGGLLHTNVVAGAIFGATCGSSVAGTAAVGSVALPQLKKRGYDREITYGSITSGGSMSTLIPPSLTMIVYGAVCGQSVGRIFIAGVLPGILMTALFMSYIAARCIKNPKLAPKEVVTRQQLIQGTLAFIPIIGLIMIVLGSIYAGIATPTEAAALGAIAAMVLAALYRKLSLGALKKAAWEAGKMTSLVMFLVVGAMVYSTGLSVLRIPQAATALMLGVGVDKYVVLAGVIGIFLVLGCLMEATPIMFLTLPLVYPVVVTGLHFDPIWFAIVMVISLQIGFLSPPFGMDCFLVHKLSGDKELWPVFRGSIPFMAVMLLTLLIVVLFPEVATFLPDRMMG